VQAQPAQHRGHREPQLAGAILPKCPSPGVLPYCASSRNSDERQKNVNGSNNRHNRQKRRQKRRYARADQEPLITPTHSPPGRSSLPDPIEHHSPLNQVNRAGDRGRGPRHRPTPCPLHARQAHRLEHGQYNPEMQDMTIGNTPGSPASPRARQPFPPTGVPARLPARIEQVAGYHSHPLRASR
jgi:hypothetical protein